MAWSGCLGRWCVGAGMFCLLAAGPVGASVIWSGDPSKGTSVFKLLNLEDAAKNEQPNPSANGSSIATSTDPTYGADWVFSKAMPDLRAEAHGANGFNPAIGSTYYIGWRFKVNSTVTDNAVFQWKAFGSPLQQNFPIVLKFVNGALRLDYFAPGVVENVLWQQNESANQWYSVVLAIKVEADTTGTINFWFNGVEQNLASQGDTYSGRTFDGTSVDPKWGIYGAVGTQVTNNVADIKIGTTFADVALPEPGAVGVMALASVGVLGGRPRRRHQVTMTMS